MLTWMRLKGSVLCTSWTPDGLGSIVKMLSPQVRCCLARMFSTFCMRDVVFYTLKPVVPGFWIRSLANACNVLSLDGPRGKIYCLFLLYCISYRWKSREKVLNLDLCISRKVRLQCPWNSDSSKIIDPYKITIKVRSVYRNRKKYLSAQFSDLLTRNILYKYVR